MLIKCNRDDPLVIEQVLTQPGVLHLYHNLISIRCHCRPCIFFLHATTHARIFLVKVTEVYSLMNSTWFYLFFVCFFKVLPGIMQASSAGISGFDMFQSRWVWILASFVSRNSQQGILDHQLSSLSVWTWTWGSREATGKMDQNIDLER